MFAVEIAQVCYLLLYQLMLGDISQLLHYGRCFIDADAFVQATLYTNRLKFLRKERKKERKLCEDDRSL